MPLTIGGEGTRVTNEVRVEGNQEVVADRPLIDRDAPRDLPLPRAGEVVVPTRLAIDLIEKWGTGGKIDHAGILANGGYRAFNRDLREATEGSSKWEIAAQLDGVITDTARYYSLREQGTKLLALIGRTRQNPSLGSDARKLSEELAKLDPSSQAIAIGYMNPAQQALVRDLDFVRWDKKQGAWFYRDPLADRAALFDASRLARIATADSPGNAAYSNSGDLYTSFQSAGRDQPAPAFHLGKLSGGAVVPYPSADYQKSIGALLGVRVLPKPAELGAGEMLVGLDWKESRLIAIDLSTDKEIFRADLPDPFVQSLLGFTRGALSFHNDLALVGGRFYISNPPKGSIGVFTPNWREPSKSKFEEILGGDDAATARGGVSVMIRGKKIELELFKIFGRGIETDFGSGVDSIAAVPTLNGKGPHLLFSPLTPNGAAKLYAMPLDRSEPPRAIARIPINDGFTVFEVGGKQLLFGTDVQGGGAFVMDLETEKMISLVRDPARVGWADGMAVRANGDQLEVTFAASGLDRSLGGDRPAPEHRGLYRITMAKQELLSALEQAPESSFNDRL